MQFNQALSFIAIEGRLSIFFIWSVINHRNIINSKGKKNRHRPLTFCLATHYQTLNLVWICNTETSRSVHVIIAELPDTFSRKYSMWRARAHATVTVFFFAYDAFDFVDIYVYSWLYILSLVGYEDFAVSV